VRRRRRQFGHDPTGDVSSRECRERFGRRVKNGAFRAELSERCISERRGPRGAVGTTCLERRSYMVRYERLVRRARPERGTRRGDNAVEERATGQEVEVVVRR